MVPFWVAGLQQQWTEEGLALHVLAVARHCYTPRVSSWGKNISACFTVSDDQSTDSVLPFVCFVEKGHRHPYSFL